MLFRSGELQEQMELPIRVAAADAAHVPHIGLVHPNEEVILSVVGGGELPGGLPRAADTMLRQLPAGRGIDRIADLLGAGGGGGNVDCPVPLSSPDLSSQTRPSDCGIYCRGIQRGFSSSTIYSPSVVFASV